MTVDPTLTDEELRDIEAYFLVGWPQVGPRVCRLVAALRASREEVERLRKQVIELTAEVGELKEKLHRATVLGAGWD